MAEYDRRLAATRKAAAKRARELCDQAGVSGETRAATMAEARLAANRAVSQDWRARVTHPQLFRIDTLGLPLTVEERFEIDEQGKATAWNRWERPRSLCPCCKRLPDLRPACRACKGLGWIGLRVARKLGPDWWRRDYPIVLVGGRKVPIAVHCRNTKIVG